MPRRSAADRAMDAIRTGHAQLEPPSGMAGRERQLFDETVASLPDDHLAKEDRPLLVLYVQALVQAEMAATAIRNGTTDGYWVSLQSAATRNAALMATKLRIGALARDPTHRRHRGNERRLQGDVRPWDDHCREEHRTGELHAIEQSDVASAIAVGNDAANHATPVVESGSARKPTRDELIEAGKKYSGPGNGGDNFPAPDSTAPR
jgi:hypothetical protein